MTLADIDPSTLSHSRHYPRFGGIIYVYVYDDKSPTGVTCALTLPESDSVIESLRGLGVSPFSRNER